MKKTADRVTPPAVSNAGAGALENKTARSVPAKAASMKKSPPAVKSRFASAGARAALTVEHVLIGLSKFPSP